MLLTMPSIPTNARTVLWLQRAAVVAIWIFALILWRRYQTSNGLSATEAGQRFIDNVEMAWWGILAYVAVYLIRPIVLFPASVLTVVGGLLFGPIVGIAVVIVAANTSAMIAYTIGRLLGRAPGTDRARDPGTRSLLQRWAGRMRERSFESVLIMRLLFLPYDLVNYASGFLRIKWLPFLTATALGSLPGTVSFVLLGASLERVDEGFGGIDTVALVVGVVIFALSLGLARALRQHSATSPPQRLETA